MSTGQPKRLIDPTEAFDDDPATPEVTAGEESAPDVEGSDPWAALRKTQEPASPMQAGPDLPKPSVSGSPKRPISSKRPAPELSAEQLRIRELEDRLAKSEGQKDPEPELVAAEPGSDQNILIHFLEDGFTALGQVWMRGQELEFTPGSPAYNDTIDRAGKSWLDYRDREFEQVEKWGKIMFRMGPWPGKSFKDAKFEPLKSMSGTGSVPVPTEEELTAAEKRERSRRRAAPTFPKG